MKARLYATGEIIDVRKLDLPYRINGVDYHYIGSSWNRLMNEDAFEPINRVSHLEETENGLAAFTGVKVYTYEDAKKFSELVYPHLHKTIVDTNSELFRFEYNTFREILEASFPEEANMLETAFIPFLEEMFGAMRLEYFGPNKKVNASYFYVRITRNRIFLPHEGVCVKYEKGEDGIMECKRI